MATTDDEATTTPPTGRNGAAAGNGLARAVKRYGPFVVVAVLVIGAIAIFGGGDDGDRGGGGGSAAVDSDEIDNEQLVRDGPMTPEKAELEGKAVDFGESCDTATGRVKLPIVYAPPCVQPFEGDNGGETSTGVNGAEIVLVRYESDSSLDALLSSQVSSLGADVDPGSAQQTAFDYVAVYQEVFETYGRTVRVVPYRAAGASDDTEKARADARAIADMEPFAVIGGPIRSTPVFASELAARRVLCLASCATGLPDHIIEAGYPYIWPIGPTTDESGALAAEMIGKLAGPGKAALAGDEATRTEDRVYGFAHYDTPDGDQAPVHAQMLDVLDEYGIEVTTDVQYTLDMNRMQETARSLIAQFESAGVTTVIYTGDPLTIGALTNEATAQDYHPEWILGHSYLADQALFARGFDQDQWAHGFGIHVRGSARSTEETGDAYRIYEWVYGTAPPDNTYGLIEQGIRQFFIGVHLAGPDLTPESFRDGLYRYPPTGGTPTAGQWSWGDHDVWPETDYGGQDDAAIIWWDPDAEGDDETGNPGTGLYRFANMGQRYTLGELPESLEDAGLFDEASSVTIYDELPLEDRPKDYPPPALD